MKTFMQSGVIMPQDTLYTNKIRDLYSLAYNIASWKNWLDYNILFFHQILRINRSSATVVHYLKEGQFLFVPFLALTHD